MRLRNFKDTAREFGISPAYVSLVVKAGRVRSIRVERSNLIDLDDDEVRRFFGHPEGCVGAIEMANMIGLSYKNICELARGGQIPGVKRCARWYFDPDEVIQALEKLKE